MWRESDRRLLRMHKQSRIARQAHRRNTREKDRSDRRLGSRNGKQRIEGKQESEVYVETFEDVEDVSLTRPGAAGSRLAPKSVCRQG